MAKIEDLIAQIPDERLRKGIAAEVKALKKTKKFGLVFEEHLPEMVRLPKLPVKPGELVALKRQSGNELWRVKSVEKGKATCDRAVEDYPEGRESNKEFPVHDLVVVRSFGEAIYPALVPLDRIERGGPEKPWHIVMNADNFHALQLLLYCYEAQVDVIYIDPPYNSGASDWKYNNNYVDANDPWRHSKWLSFIQKRLKLAKRLLKPEESVLIIAIDEKECLHLGMLLEQEFPEARIQMISTMVNPAIVARAGGFGRSDEYIFIIMFGGAAPNKLRLSREWVSAKGRTHTGNIRWDLLRRSGTNAERSHSPGCFYPIYVDPKDRTIKKIGDALPKGESVAKPIAGLRAVLPIRKSKSEGNWQWSPETLGQRIAQGRVRVGGSEKRGFVIYILKDGEYAKIQRGEFQDAGRDTDGSILVEDNDPSFVLAVPGSQWRISSHDSTQYGSRLLSNIIPDRKFPFPKSLYAVEDALRFFVQHKPQALILDFFGGSGTTTHAVARLNKQDNGQRRSILVTNNEVAADEANLLREKGLEPGDDKWEALGIFEQVTKPRIIAALNGNTPEGKPIVGEYRFTDEFSISDGLEENVEFFLLDFLDPNQVARGDAFSSILPILWLMAGCRGRREDSKGSQSWFIPKSSPFAVLIKEREFRAFRDEVLSKRTDVDWIFLVTDSEENFSHMRRSLGRKHKCVQLYKSYLENFRLNTPEALGNGGAK